MKTYRIQFAPLLAQSSPMESRDIQADSWIMDNGWVRFEKHDFQACMRLAFLVYRIDFVASVELLS